MDLNAFKSAFPGGFQQSHRFVGQFTFPPQVQSAIINADERSVVRQGQNPPGVFGARTNQNIAVVTALDWLMRGIVCETAALPDRSLDQVGLSLYGITEQFPIKTDYTNLSCRFLLPTLPPDIAGTRARGVDRPAVSGEGRANPIAIFFSLWQNAIHDLAAGVDPAGLLSASSRNLSFADTYRAQLRITALDRQDFPVIRYRFDRVYPQAVEAVPLSWSNVDLAVLPVTFTFSSWSIE